MSIRKGTELIAGNVNQSTVSTFKLFHHDWFDYSFSDLSWVCADDFEWIYGDRYPIAYEHLYADYISTSTYTQETIGSYTIQFKIAPDGHRIVDHANEGIVQNIYGESGVAWYYILDTVNERFKLPRTKHGLSGLRDNVGEYIAPGAPNITGGGPSVCTVNISPNLPSANCSGAIGTNYEQLLPTISGSRGNYSWSEKFDASKSNSIYGNSDTIQPPATQQYLYFYLGQFPVSALVNPDIAATKVNTNGDNFNSVGRNIANWSSNVTNCITEIPQDIKLELNDGTLTLKAGSKLYIPNGFESDGTTPKFNVRVLTEDIVRTKAESLYTVPNAMLIMRGISNFIDFWPIAEYYSGPTAPSTGNIWYDTTTNLIKRNISGTWTSEQQNLPIGLVNTSDTDGFTSINQVFNGFGYIGSTVFALPGVKGLAPNGRNDNGTLKSVELTISKVITKQLSQYSNKSMPFCLTENNILPENQYINQNNTPTTNYSLWYKPTDNILSYSSTTATFTPILAFLVGTFDRTNGVISNLQTNNVFEIYNQSSLKGPAYYNPISITLSTSTETVYICPADGYITIDTACFNGTYSYLKINGITLFNKTTNGSGYVMSVTGQYRVNKGDTVVAKSGYDNAFAGTHTLKFFTCM